MLVTAMILHRPPRQRLRQSLRCLRERKWCVVGRPARMERWLCAVERLARMERWLRAVERLARMEHWRGPRHPERMGLVLKQIDPEIQAMMLMASACDCYWQNANIYIVAQQGLS